MSEIIEHTTPNSSFIFHRYKLFDTSQTNTPQPNPVWAEYEIKTKISMLPSVIDKLRRWTHG